MIIVTIQFFLMLLASTAIAGMFHFAIVGWVLETHDNGNATYPWEPGHNEERGRYWKRWKINWNARSTNQTRTLAVHTVGSAGAFIHYMLAAPIPDSYISSLAQVSVAPVLTPFWPIYFAWTALSG